MQCIGGFLFLFVYDMRINLRGFDVSMSHQRLDGVYVNAIFQQQRSIAMPPTMEGDVLLDTGCFYPDFQRREIQEASVNPSKTSASSSSGRMPHS